MSGWWERLTQPRSSPDKPAGSTRTPDPRDKEGILLFETFTDCLNEHKRTVLYAAWAVTIPLSIYKKSAGPVFLGTMLAVIPDMWYANWRCDDHYKLFQQHVASHVKELLSDTDG